MQQTGSNFGQMVKHENPYLSVIGSGTMVADGLSIINADFSEHVVPGVPGQGRGAQLPREPHRLPLAEQGG